MESYPGCCCIWLVPKEELQSAPMRRMSFLLFLFTHLARFSKNSFQSDSELVDVGAYADIRKIYFFRNLGLIEDFFFQYVDKITGFVIGLKKNPEQF